MTTTATPAGIWMTPARAGTTTGPWTAGTGRSDDPRAGGDDVWGFAFGVGAYG